MATWLPRPRPWPAAGPGWSRSAPHRSRRRASRTPAGRMRRAGPRTARGPVSATSCRDRSTPARSAGGPSSTSHGQPRRPRRHRPRPAPGCGSRCRTRRGWPGSRRRCWSRRHRRRPSKIGVVQRPHDIRAGHVQDLVAPLVTLEVVEAQVVGLQHGPRRPVRDHNTTGKGCQKVFRHGSLRLRGAPAVAGHCAHWADCANDQLVARMTICSRGRDRRSTNRPTTASPRRADCASDQLVARMTICPRGRDRRSPQLADYREPPPGRLRARPAGCPYDDLLPRPGPTIHPTGRATASPRRADCVERPAACPYDDLPPRPGPTIHPTGRLPRAPAGQIARTTSWLPV